MNIANNASVFAPCKWLGAGVLIGIGLWLLLAALIVDVEKYDGYDAVCNSKYFIGTSNQYIANRAPLMGMFLVPAESIRIAWQLTDLDLRPHHLQMALLHITYLLLIWFYLQRQFQNQVAILLSFVATIPCFVFFSYAPFINLDIFPGVLLLVMIVTAEKFLVANRLYYWLLLVLCGSSAVLIKQTYVVFWGAILVAHAILQPLRKTPCATLGYLLLAALSSAAITWSVLSWTLAATYRESHWLLRPYLQAQFILGQYRGEACFPWWIYLRNFHFFGILTTLLIIPGLILALRRHNLLQSMALVWLLCFAALHAINMREVRYMAFLTPLSAFLIIPVIELLLSKCLWRILMLLVLCGDFAIALPEAMRIQDNFYRNSSLKQFLSVLTMRKSDHAPVIMRGFLNFVASRPNLMAADRYHRLFHFGPRQLRILKKCNNVVVIGRASNLHCYAARYPEAVLFFASNNLVNPPTWQAKPPLDLATFRQYAGIAGSMELQRDTHGYRSAHGKIHLYQHRQIVIAQAPMLRVLFYPCITTAKHSYHLRRIDDDRCAIVGMKELPGNKDRLATLWGFWVVHYIHAQLEMFYVSIQPQFH